VTAKELYKNKALLSTWNFC